MTGIFPDAVDGGIPPNSSDPNNPKAAYPPVTYPLNTPALYYGNGCDVRLRPEVINSLISEIEATVDQANLAYDMTSRENLERAARYLIQRGLARSCYMYGGPQNYGANLDPPMTGYNNYLTLTVVPDATNIAIVTINIDGKGAVPILRNDSRNLEPGDLVAGKPYIIAFVNGAFYMCGLCASQVPIIVKGGIACWIRTDGNDITGDGTANTPDKAFRTIAGCWVAVGSRYAATPLFSINMYLGIPGTYEGAVIGPFGGSVSLTGDINDPASYRLSNIYIGSNTWCSLWVNGIQNCVVMGVTFEQTTVLPRYSLLSRCGLGSTTFSDCRWEVMVDNPNCWLYDGAPGGGWWGAVGNATTKTSHLRFIGNGHIVSGVFNGWGAASFFGAAIENASYTCNYHFSDLICRSAGVSVVQLSQMAWGSASSWSVANVTGPQYGVYENSVLSMGGKALLGSTPGSIGSGGRFIP